MEKRILILARILFAFPITFGVLAAADGAEQFRKTWSMLLEKEEYAQAETTCKAWLTSSDRTQRLEAYRCLAYAEYFLAPDPKLGVVQSNDKGGAFIRPTYDGKRIDMSLGYIAEAIAMQPNDISLHKMRLDILIGTGRYEETAVALENSLATYRGSKTADRWLDYSGRFLADGMFREGLSYMQILEKRFPNDHRVVANVGTMHMALKNETEASAYLVRALRMKPDDPINNWNLARFYDFKNRNEEADRYYRKALDLYARVEPDREGYCMYAAFLEKKMGDLKRAGELRGKYCSQDR